MSLTTYEAHGEATRVRSDKRGHAVQVWSPGWVTVQGSDGLVCWHESAERADASARWLLNEMVADAWRRACYRGQKETARKLYMWLAMHPRGGW